jgi:cysteinyl-tRNA synthetase
MSKSTGHFFAIEDIVKEFDPDVIRFYLLSSHYRSPMEFSRERLAETRSALARMANTFRSVEARIGDAEPEGSPEDLDGPDLEFWKRVEAKERLFVEAMDDDFNSAGAIGHIFDIAKDVNLHLKGADSASRPLVLKRALEKIKELGDVLGIFRSIGGEVLKLEDLPGDVQDLVGERAKARLAKDWATADSIRNQLAALGFFLEDRPEGTIIRKG